MPKSKVISPYLTTGEVATYFGVSTWQVRRLFERELLPECQRVGSYRVIPREQLLEVEKLLRETGYLKEGKKGKPTNKTKVKRRAKKRTKVLNIEVVPDLEIPNGMEVATNQELVKGEPGENSNNSKVEGSIYK